MNKTKIVHLVTSLDKGGGIQQIVKYICNNISSDKYDIEVLFLKGEDKFAQYFENSIRIKRIEKFDKSIIVGFINLIIILVRSKPDILHVHSPIAGFFGRITSIFFIFKVITTNHNSYFPLHYKILDYLSLYLSDYIVGVSNEATRYNYKKTILSQFQKDKFVTIPNGISLERFKTSNEDISKLDNLCKHIGISKKDFVVGFVGRLVEQKGCDIAIETIKELLPYVPNAKLVIVGWGEQNEQLHELVRKLNIKDSVFFLGERYDIELLFKSFDVSIFPSRWEGFGLAPVEAMASGCPVIVSSLPVFKEIVGYGGIFVSNHPSSFAKKISKIYNNQLYKMELSKKAKLRSKKFSHEKMVIKYDTLYNALMNNQKKK